MIFLCLMAFYLRRNYLMFVTDDTSIISDTFYLIHVTTYIVLTLICIIILYINNIRGRNLWIFAFILYFDGLMIWPWIQGHADDLVNYSNFSLQLMIGFSLTYLLFSELINIRHIRLGVRLPTCWDTAMKSVLLYYLIESTYILSLYY